MPTYTFQVLGAADVAPLRQLLAVFAEAFEDPASYAGAPPDDAYLAGMLSRQHIIPVVALDGTRVVGGLVAYVLDKLEQNRREIYIYDLAVLETHRRRGLATGLIERLKTEARERDAYVIFVQADLVDAPAIALYRSLGTEETAHHYDIAVELPVTVTVAVSGTSRA